MTHHIKLLLALALVPVFASAKTAYSGEFDYRYFQSTQQYFSGRTAAEISKMCSTGDHANNDDLAQCSHLKFDRASAELDKSLASIRSRYGHTDHALKDEGEPLGSPYFEKGQAAWLSYRDNECYSETYIMGDAAERYIFFWECMANITQGRVKELDYLLKD